VLKYIRENVFLDDASQAVNRIIHDATMLNTTNVIHHPQHSRVLKARGCVEDVKVLSTSSCQRAILSC